MAAPGPISPLQREPIAIPDHHRERGHGGQPEAIVAIRPAPQLTNVQRLVFAGGVKRPVPDQATQAVDDKTLTAADNATDMMCGPMTAILTATR